MRRLIISESQYKKLASRLDKGLNLHVDPRKVMVVKNFLDKNFERAALDGIGDDGYPKSTPIVGMKGSDGSVIRNMSARQLFFLLQDRFQSVYTDSGIRDAFLRQVMRDWYYRKITPEGLLSKNKIERDMVIKESDLKRIVNEYVKNTLLNEEIGDGGKAEKAVFDVISAFDEIGDQREYTEKDAEVFVKQMRVIIRQYGIAPEEFNKMVRHMGATGQSLNYSDFM